MVLGFNMLPGRNTLELGLIDTAGNWIVSYGRYKYVYNLNDGYTRVELYDNDAKDNGEPTMAVIDKEGKQKFIVPDEYFFGEDDYFYGDIATVSIYFPGKRDKWHTYKGVINSDGKILFSDKNWREMTPFSYNRAFIFDSETQHWKMINTKGEMVGHTYFNFFNKILYDRFFRKQDVFIDGFAVVLTAEGWVAVDTSGTFLTDPHPFIGVEDGYLSREGETIYYSIQNEEEDSLYPFRSGFWNIKNDSTVKAEYQQLDRNGFSTSLAYAVKNGKKCFINSSGTTVWQEPQWKAKSEYLNIDYMNWNYFYASSKYLKELPGYEGIGDTVNLSKPIANKEMTDIKQLKLIIDTAKSVKWKNYKGITLYVANYSHDTLYFDAHDGPLYMYLQAKDKNGEWRDIECIPTLQRCVVSYRTLFLASNEFWEFAIPVYQGEFRTKLRARLLYSRSAPEKTLWGRGQHKLLVWEQNKNEVIYSNEIDGYVNPGQFWNKLEHFPIELMYTYKDR
jgi:hypothetical protein